MDNQHDPNKIDRVYLKETEKHIVRRDIKQRRAFFDSKKGEEDDFEEL